MKSVQTSTRPKPLLSEDEISRLNDARTILDRLRANAFDRSHTASTRYDEPRAVDFGYLAAMAEAASGAVFNTLNAARSYCDEKISDDQMHNREGVVS